MAYIEFKDVIKAYGEGDARIHALDGASFTVERGELAIILGASGAGKTTALNILGGMDTVTSGTVTVDGRTRLQNRQADLAAAAGYLPQAGHYGHHHHAQLRARAHGRSPDSL